MIKKRLIILGALIAVPLTLMLWRSNPTQDALTTLASNSDRVVPDSEFPDRVYWGDTHLHTSNSPDAFGFGVRLGPDESLRFAKGEEVTSTLGVKAKLSRPLDFLVIADHSDGLGFSKMLHDAPRFMLPNDTLKRWHDMFRESPESSQKATAEMIDFGRDPEAARKLADPDKQLKRTESIWKKSIRTIERHNDPGNFTAFLGYEYTSQPDGNNLHRVVMYRDGFEKGKRLTPFTAMTNSSPVGLWDWMELYEETTGGQVLAIPHNSNVSNGVMFELTDPSGGPMSAEYARRRIKHEPIVEVTQIKGDSESHPFLSPNDEFSGFGTTGWDLANIDMSVPKTPEMLGGEYIREALKRGLAIEEQTGVNPYQFGLIGSTDSHTGLATADEDNFFGKHTGNEPGTGEDRMSKQMNLGTREGRFNWNYLAGGYSAAWATANTRAAIFDAFARKEVYATTGPRMTVRLFGGWDFQSSDLGSDWIKAGYTRGVPMGATLRTQESDAPTFMIAAAKDPEGANLDRIQMVKGWYGLDGKLHEKVFDVDWSDVETRIVLDGVLPKVGNTVDLATGEYENTIGATQFTKVWTDPDFDSSLRAFYYVRVIEIPTPRWIVYDSVKLGLEITPDMNPVAQERAYTSPIWYVPG